METETCSPTAAAAVLYVLVELERCRGGVGPIRFTIPPTIALEWGGFGGGPPDRPLHTIVPICTWSPGSGNYGRGLTQIADEDDDYFSGLGITHSLPSWITLAKGGSRQHLTFYTKSEPKCGNRGIFIFCWIAQKSLQK